MRPADRTRQHPVDQYDLIRSFTSETVAAPAAMQHAQLKEWVARIALLTQSERIHGLPNGPMEAILTHELQGNVIRRAWSFARSWGSHRGTGSAPRTRYHIGESATEPGDPNPRFGRSHSSRPSRF